MNTRQRQRRLRTSPLEGFAVVTLLVASFGLQACMRPQGATPDQKRADIRTMEQEVLADLYEAQPELRSVVQNSAGYAVFSNFESKIFVVGAGNGYGVVVDNSSGKRTYMRVAKLEGGVGMGLQTLRQVMVFSKPSTMKIFIERGLELGGNADATGGLQGDRVGASVDVAARMTDPQIYQLTETGASVTAMVGGARYWKDDELN